MARLDISEPGPEPGPELGGVRLRLAMILVTGAMFMEILDGSIIATALPAMARSFGTTALRLNVGISAYLLALGVFIPLSGWVADRFGARTVFAAAIALFTASSAACGAAQGLPMFVAIRVVQGMAGAMMVPVGRLVILRFTPKERLMATISALVWPALVAPVLGPPLGGFIAAHADWRWIFYLNVPIGIAALAAALLVIPNVRGEARAFDLPGFLLSGIGTFALLAGLDRAVERIDGIAVALVCGGLVVTAFALRHLARAAAPMIGLAPYRIETFRASIRGGSLLRMGIGSAPFLLPLMFQVGFGYDAVRSGLLVLAVFVGNLGMKAVTTPILRRFGYRPVMLWNGALCAASLGACALLQPATPVFLTVPLLIVGGMTRSMQFTTLATIAFADVPKDEMSDANSLFNTVSQISAAAGVTLAALGVRAAHELVGAFHLGGTALDFRGAFLIVALLTLAGLIDAARLPKGAGDSFIHRRA